MSDDKEKYAGLIRQLIPVNELSPQIQKEFINKSEILEIRKRKFIFNQGDRDEYSFYLLEGEIEFYADKRLQSEIKGGADRARYAMAQLQPRQFSAKAKSNCIVLRIRRDSVDQLHILQGESSTNIDGMEVEGDVDVTTVDFSDDDGMDWMTRMFQSELFSRLPTANIHGLFALLTPLELKKGDVVITQGEPGDCYYIIQEGQCQVSRKSPSGGKEVNLAVLKPGDSFGEEALISDTTRNATVSMQTDGIVMQLSKDDFINLIKKPALQSISFSKASKLVEGGNHRWLDVRFKNEHQDSSIPGSINTPLNLLRMEMDKLDRETTYIVYCDTGGRSSTGAFLLTEGGFNACYLEGGLVNSPQAAVTPEDAPQQKKKPSPAPTKKEAVAAPAEEDTGDEDLDPDVKSSILETELARTNMELDDLEKSKLETKNISEQEMQKEVERRLKEERAKIEEAKKAADVESRKLRDKEETKIKQMQEEAAKRLQEEKKRLEEVYSRNAEEMEKLQKMKDEAEKQLNEEKAKLEKQSEESRKQLEEAEQLKRELEQSKQSMEGESQKSRKEREEAELKLREAERLKQELEQSKKQFEEDAQQKIQQQREETDRLKKELEQSKQNLEGESLKSREEAEQKLKEAERLKQELEQSRKQLEEQAQQKIQEQREEAKKKIEEAEKIKKELEQAKQHLESETLKKQKEQEDMTQKIQAKAREKLEQERKKMAEEFSRSQDELEQAKKERAAAEAARKAAKDEAAKIIEEFKKKHAEDKAQEEEKIKAERLKLEEEQLKIQQSMLEIQKAREEAENARLQAVNDVEELRTKQAAQKSSKDKAARVALEQELKDAEEKISRANLEIEKVEQAAIEVDAADKLNKEDLIKQIVIEEEVAKQLEADLKDFRKENEEKAASVTNISSQMEHMRRIRMKAEAAKQEAKEATVNMLSEIESQLGSDD